VGAGVRSAPVTGPGRIRVSALAGAVVLALLVAIPARAAGKTVHITKSDSAGNAVAGATFTLYVDAAPVGGGPPKGAEDTVVQGTCTTGANGQCDITDVPPGNYWVSETGPPAGYAAAPDSTLEVKKGKKKVFEVVVVDDKKPANTSVNDSTEDEQVGDGTHIFQFGPVVAVSDNGKKVAVAFNDSAGFVLGDYSGIGFAFSTNGGKTFEDLGQVPPNSDQRFILAQPSAIFDPGTGKVVVAADGAVVDNNVLSGPILVSIFDPGTESFGNPIDTFPGIPPDPSSAHDPGLAVDPVSGRLYLTFTVSNGSGQAEGFLTRSNNGGERWKKPISVTGPGTNDFLIPRVAGDGTLYLSWVDFGGAGSTTNDVLFTRSTDGGLTFASPIRIANNVLKSGTETSCGGTTRHTYLGRLVTADAPRLAVDPSDPSRILATFPSQGTSDESDILYLTSEDGGKTWSDPVHLPTSPGVQMFPDAQVTPDGRLGVTYYSATSPSSIDYVASIAPILDGPPVVFTSMFPVNDGPFPAWNTLGPYDTAYNSCFGMQGNQFAAPGSGFFMAWADGGDPGPAANGGVDPNVDFARVDPSLPTSTTLSIAAKGSSVHAAGRVAPDPVLGARVTVTLFVDLGAGGFTFADRVHPTLGDGGVFGVSFTKPGGRCELVVKFGGSEGRLPSSVSKTFDC
jgi:hypothetical protein